MRHLLLLREGVEPGRFGCHRRSSCRGRHKIPVSCRTEVEVAGQVGETGVQVARDELTVGGGGGDGVVHTVVILSKNVIKVIIRYKGARK